MSNILLLKSTEMQLYPPPPPPDLMYSLGADPEAKWFPAELVYKDIRLGCESSSTKYSTLTEGSFSLVNKDIRLGCESNSSEYYNLNRGQALIG